MAIAHAARQGGQSRRSGQGDTKEYKCRAYIRRRSDGVYVAVCLRPYLVAEGRTLGEAKQHLFQLMEGYITDAVADGNLDAFLRRRAPLRHYLACFWAWVAHRISSSCKIVTKTCCIPQHA